MKQLLNTGTVRNILILIGILLPVIISSFSCRDGEKEGRPDNGTARVQDTTFFDTLRIDKAQRAGDVAYLNKKRIANDLILVNDGSKNNRVYLMDKNAEIRHEWALGRNIGKDAYLMPNGKLLTMMTVDSPQTNFGGQAGMVQLIAKDGTVDWEFTHASDDYITHHDAEMLPNGHIITLVRERKSMKEAQRAGSQLGIDVYSEAVIEINPFTNEIVWEWHAWDHLVQEADTSKENYGVIAEHPELINLNFASKYKGDIMHANGITYDPEKKLIFLTINWFSEVWVIDHSTSTEEAAGHVGGNYNKGGDLVYRFGNPGAYNNSEGEPLFDNVHTPYFVDYGADPYTHLLVFSNKMGGKEQSIVYELDLSGEFALKPQTDNEPRVVWSFTDPELFGGKVSGAARQANGNTLITEGDYGIWEVTPDKEVVWKFKGEGAFFWRAYPYDRNAAGIRAILP
jgi:hypothetical protein